MKTLYYVVAYSFRTNEYARFVLTAQSAEDAEQEVLQDLGGDWKVPKVREICRTDEGVFKEL